jgi:hypothetical protein
MKKSHALFQNTESCGIPRNRLGIMAGLALSLLAIVGNVGAQKATESNWTDTFPVEEFSSTGMNPYFILKPGYFLILEGAEDGKKVQLTITVLNETKTIDGVETRIVEEREKSIADDKLIEISRNYFAIGKKTNSVYYFGEEVDMYKNGQVASHEGSWQSGIKGARFGVAMPGIALVGSRYYQEVAPGIAMDRAEHVSMTERVESPAGSFKNCLRVRESTPLESSSKDFKIYADGVGLVEDNELKLIKYGNR